MSEEQRPREQRIIAGAEDGRVPGVLETLRRTVAFVPMNCRDPKGSVQTVMCDHTVQAPLDARRRRRRKQVKEQKENGRKCPQA